MRLLPLSAALLGIGCSRAPEPPPPPEPPPDLAPSEWRDGPVLPKTAFVVDSEGPEADLKVTSAFLQSRPAHQRSLTAGLEPVPGLPDLFASTCAGCHPEATSQWQGSAHAHAWTDPLFQAELWQAEHRWVCLACHTPLLMQQDFWPRDVVRDAEGTVTGVLLSPNDGFQPGLRAEGVTCAVCHVRDGLVLGGREISDAPHPVIADPALQSGAVCLRCHQVAEQAQQIPFPCTAQTSEEGQLANSSETCVSCHMPATENGRHHGWIGPTGPTAHRGSQAAANSALSVDLRVEGRELAVRWSNASAAHRLPTTDRSQYLQLDLAWLDLPGETLDSWTHRIGRLTGPPPDQALHADQRLLPGETRVQRLAIPPGAAQAQLTVTAWRVDPTHGPALNLPEPPPGVEVHRQVLRLTEAHAP